MATQPQTGAAIEKHGPQPQTNNQTIALIKNILETKKGEIAKALPRHISPDKMIRVALTLISGDGKLLTCDPVTIYAEVLKAAQLGLYIDGFLGQAHLVPFWNNKRGKNEAKLMLGYRGLIELAMRTGKVTQIRAVPVHEGDLFEYEEGLVSRLVHRRQPDPKKRGPLAAVYAVAELKDVPRESSPFRVMFADEVLAIRARSKNAFDKEGKLQGPWLTDEVEMWKKTAVRSLCKYLNLSTELTGAAVADEYGELGITTIEGTVAPVEPEVPEVQNISSSANAALKEKIEQKKNGQNGAAKPAEESQAGTSTEEVADKAEGQSTPDPFFPAEMPGRVRGTVTEVAQNKPDMVTVKLGKEIFSLFHQSLFQPFLEAKGQVAIFDFVQKGKFKHIEKLHRIGATEYGWLTK